MTATKRKTSGRNPSGEKLVVRRARASDRDAIFELSRSIWGGNDYMPIVWERWLKEKDGVLLTVTHNGRPVGVSKVSLLAPGEVWLEGLRLHPDLQGKGLAGQINRVTFREAMKLNPRSVRYSTGAGNGASRHLAEKRGFWQVAWADWMWGTARPSGSDSVRRARDDELSDVLMYVRDSECFREASGLYARGWRFQELNRRALRRLIRRGQLLVVRRRGRLSAVAVYDHGHIDDDICLGYADGTDEDIAALANEVLAVAHRSGIEEASAMLPSGRIAAAAFRAGFNAEMPGRAVVYELGARGRKPDDEPLRDVLWRTVRSRSDELIDAATETIVAATPEPVSPKNVRDFVVRNLIPDTTRDVYTAMEVWLNQLPSFELRNTLRGVVAHLIRRCGVSAETMQVGTRHLAFSYRGVKMASIHAGRRSLRVVVSPGRPCAALGRRFRVLRQRPSGPGEEEHLQSVSLWLSGPEHVAGATKAIDAAARCVDASVGR